MKKIHFCMALIAGLMMFAGCASTGRTLSKVERANLLIEAASGALNEGDPSGALAFLLEAEQYDTENAALYHIRALALYQKKDLEGALASAKRATLISPQFSDAQNTLGKIYLDQGEYKKAEEVLSKAAKDQLYRDNYKPLTNLGILEYRRGNLDKSEKYLSEAIENRPELTCIAYYYRGHVQLKKSKLQQAIRDYDRAGQKFCGGFSEAHLALGVAYQQSKKYDQARKKYVEVADRFPNSKASEQALEYLRYLP